MRIPEASLACDRATLHRGPVIALCVGIGFYAVVATLNAWVAEDAYIAFRTADNLIHGEGLRWNVAERVQTFTCPLWVLLFAACDWFTREAYFTSLGLCGILSLASVAMVAWSGRRTPWIAVTGLLLLTLSRAFIDYSSSCMENPLSHLLLGIFIANWLADSAPVSRRFLLLCLTGALLALNRLDQILIVFPAVCVAAWSQPSRRKAVAAVLLGGLPLIAWETFSVIYYGFPFPNTAYAKLGHGIEQREMLLQGCRYFRNSLVNDPLTLAGTVAGVAAAVTARSRRGLTLAGGIALYCAYVVAVGGDYMSGRFLTAPLYASVMLLVMRPPNLPRPAVLCAVSLVALNGVMLPGNPVLAWQVPPLPAWSDLVDESGIANERGVYYPHLGLFGKQRQSFAQRAREPKSLERRTEELDGYRFGPQVFGAYFLTLGLRDRAAIPDVHVRVTTNAGIRCYHGGPQVHYIDVMALGDPLLARLPAFRVPQWRIGHFQRVLPEGYDETIASGSNRIADPELAEYYDKLALITRGRLLDPARWKAIVAMNLGRFDHLIDRAYYRNPPRQRYNGKFESDPFQDVFDAAPPPTATTETDVPLPPARGDRNSGRAALDQPDRRGGVGT